MSCMLWLKQDVLNIVLKTKCKECNAYNIFQIIDAWTVEVSLCP